MARLRISAVAMLAIALFANGRRGWWCGRRSRFSRPNRLDAARSAADGESGPDKPGRSLWRSSARRAAERAWELSGSAMVTVYRTPSTHPRVTWWSPSAGADPVSAREQDPFASGTRPRARSSARSAIPQAGFKEISLSPDGKTLATIELLWRAQAQGLRDRPRTASVAYHQE